MEQVNEYELSFRGRACISSPLKRGIDYTFKVIATIPKAEIEDCEDGTINLHYKARLITAETEAEGKKVKTVARQRWSKSQQVRFNIEKYFDENEINFDKEGFYSIVMDKFIEELPNFIKANIKI